MNKLTCHVIDSGFTVCGYEDGTITFQNYYLVNKLTDYRKFGKVIDIQIKNNHIYVLFKYNIVVFDSVLNELENNNIKELEGYQIYCEDGLDLYMTCFLVHNSKVYIGFNTGLTLINELINDRRISN